MALTKIKADGLTADLIDETKLADNSIDSEHYNDGSIDNAHLADDAVGVAELSATGTASSSTFLRGDNSWATPTDTNTVTTINNNADNRVITGSGTANTLEGESTLTYSSNTLLSTSDNFVIKSIDTNASNAENYIQFNAGYITYDSDASDATGYSGHYFQADGAEKLRINGSGQLIFDADTNTYLARPAADTFAFTTGGTERLRIDASGNVIIRGTSLNNSSVSGQALQVNGTDRPTLILRGNASGSNTAEIQFADNSGSDSDTGTRSGLIQYAHSDNSMRLYTAETERMRIEGGNFKILDGDLVIGASGHGIDFSDTSDATGKSSELLDDYEEGEFRATDDHGGSWSGANNECTYTKIGRIVHIHGQIKAASGSGNVRLNLPFTSRDGTDEAACSAGALATYDWNAANSSDSDTRAVLVDEGVSYARFVEVADNGAWTELQWDTNAYLRFGFTYLTDS